MLTNASISELEKSDRTDKRTEDQHLASGFVQVGHNVETIIRSAYPSSILSGHNSVGQ